MSTATIAQQIEARVYEALAELGPDIDEITPDATFESLDIDSLDMVEISQILNQEFGIEMNPDDFSDVKTVGEAVVVITGYTR